MTNINNSILVINLTLCLCAMTTNAQTPIATQELRFDALSDLSYQIKLTKSRVELTKFKTELAKLQQQCLENNGCDLSNNSYLTAIGNNSHLDVTDNNNHLATTDNNNHLAKIGNNSHLSTTDNNSNLVAVSGVAKKPILATSTIKGDKNTKQLVKNPPEHLQANSIKKLNSLSIIAIINKQVVFKDIEGYFQLGDVLDESGIKIIAITDSGVVLSTANNLNKTLTMDWIND